MFSQILSKALSTNIAILKNLLNVLLIKKKNDLIEFKDILELFHNDTEETKPDNEDQEKDLEKSCDKYIMLILCFYLMIRSNSI